MTPLVVGQKYTAVLSTNARIANGSRSVKEPVNYSFVASGREYATVQAGGSVTFSNGIRVDVPTERIEPIELFMEEVPVSAVRVPLEGYAAHAISPYYRIGTTGEDTGAGGYKIVFPVPVGENYLNLGVMFLTPDQGEVDNNDWHGSAGGKYTENNLPFTHSATIYHDGSIYVLAKQDNTILNSATASIRLSSRTKIPYEVICFQIDECPQSLKDEISIFAENSYNHWLGIMKLSQGEYPPLTFVELQSSKSGTCLKTNGDGAYVFADTTIYICIEKNYLGEWIFAAHETIQEVIFHEMFHGVQWGIAKNVRISPKDTGSPNY